MIRESELTKEHYKTGEVAKMIGVSTRTMQRYDIDGVTHSEMLPSGRRAFPKNEVIRFLDERGLLYHDIEEQRHDVVYARVSSYDQKKHGDLDRQALHIVETAGGLLSPVILKECGSGLNDKRPQLAKLMDMVSENKVRNVYVTYQDRLTRFGYHYLERFFAAHGTSIIVLEDEREKKSVEEELAKDMMDLLASFSGKLYGRRSHKNMKKNAGEKDMVK